MWGGPLLYKMHMVSPNWSSGRDVPTFRDLKLRGGGDKSVNLLDFLQYYQLSGIARFNGVIFCLPG